MRRSRASDRPAKDAKMLAFSVPPALELGGSNDLKNLWPQPDDPCPGDAEKGQLENELHKRVCKGEMPLADAQKCIESNWVECCEKYIVPEYGPEWAATYRRGW